MPYSGSFAITSISGNAVTQNGVYFVGRNSSTGVGSALIAGTYTGDVPQSMTAACGGAGSVSLSLFAAGSGVWSGRLQSLATGTSLSLVARNVSAEDSSPLVMANFGCGDFGIIAGQSNSNGQIEEDFNGSGDMFPPAHITGSVMFWYDTKGDQTFKLEVPRRDYHMTRAFSILSRKTGVPICTVNLGVAGTTIADWSYPSGSNWLLAVTELTAAKVIGSGNLATVLWWQGEQDRLMPNKAVYKNALLQLVRDMRSQWGILEVLAVPPVWSLAASIATATLEAAIGDETNLYVAACTSDIRSDAPDYGDESHIKRPQEAQILGDRIGQTLIWRAGYPSPSIGLGVRPIGSVRYLQLPRSG